MIERYFVVSLLIQYIASHCCLLKWETLDSVAMLYYPLRVYDLCPVCWKCKKAECFRLFNSFFLSLYFFIILSVFLSWNHSSNHFHWKIIHRWIYNKFMGHKLCNLWLCKCFPPKIIWSKFCVRKIQSEAKWKITPQTWIILPKWQCHVATSFFCVFSFDWISLTKFCPIMIFVHKIPLRESKCESWWHRAEQKMCGALISKSEFASVEHVCVAFIFRTKRVESSTHKMQCIFRATNTYTHALCLHSDRLIHRSSLCIVVGSKCFKFYRVNNTPNVRTPCAKTKNTIEHWTIHATRNSVIESWQNLQCDRFYFYL